MMNQKLNLKLIEMNGIEEEKEFDSGDIPLSVTCELVSTCNLACTMCYTITEKFQNCGGRTENDALENC